jgi:hypothetical protein
MYAIFYNDSNSGDFATIYKVSKKGTTDWGGEVVDLYECESDKSECEVLYRCKSFVPVNQIGYFPVEYKHGFRYKLGFRDTEMCSIVDEAGFEALKFNAAKQREENRIAKESRDAAKQIRVDAVNKFYKSSYTIDDDILSLEQGMKSYNKALDKAIETGQDQQFESEFYNNFSKITGWFVKPNGDTYSLDYEA